MILAAPLGVLLVLLCTHFPAPGADFPSIAQAPGGWLLAHRAQMSSDGTYAYDVQLARADSLGSPWRQIGKAHDDETQTEHGFVAFVPDGNQIRVFWLDGRETKSESGASEHGGGNMSLRTALGGETVRFGRGPRFRCRVGRGERPPSATRGDSGRRRFTLSA